MKHTLQMTFLLLTIFIIAQLAGLVILTQYVDVKTTASEGTTIVYNETYAITGITPPEIENESQSFIPIILAVFVGTILVLLIIRFKQRRLWKMWFFLSATLCLALAFAPFIGLLILAFNPNLLGYAYIATFALAIALAYGKIFKQNLIVHNITEVFIYGGLAAVIVPIVNLFSVVMLLILISLYDAYAVWKSKHMVTMAQFQTQEKLFAGLYLPYPASPQTQVKFPEETSRKQKTVSSKMQAKYTLDTPPSPTTASPLVPKIRSAVLGGGDIAFPLIFSGVVMKTSGSYLPPLVLTITSATALLVLLLFSKKDRFYPAMPFITAGCFLGYGLLFALGLL